jgi:hypothetical protein
MTEPSGRPLRVPLLILSSIGNALVRGRQIKVERCREKRRRLIVENSV